MKSLEYLCYKGFYLFQLPVLSSLILEMALFRQIFFLIHWNWNAIPIFISLFFFFSDFWYECLHFLWWSRNVYVNVIAERWRTRRRYCRRRRRRSWAKALVWFSPGGLRSNWPSITSGAVGVLAWKPIRFTPMSCPGSLTLLLVLPVFLFSKILFCSSLENVYFFGTWNDESAITVYGHNQWKKNKKT